MYSREEFMARLTAGAKETCPCCGRHAQVYNRRIHAGMAMQLIKLYKLGGNESYVHASRLILKNVSGAADLSKAKYWALIEEMPHVAGRTKSSGHWRLTKLGVQFVHNEVAVPESVQVYNDTVIGASQRVARIRDCLKNKFDYEELMEGL